MTEFTITSTKWESEIRLVFYDNGFLASAELPEVIDRKAMEFFATHFPTHVSVLDFIRENSRATITRIALDTKFETFWERYAKKVGSKELARQYWDGEKKTITKRPVTLTDRENIMITLDKYVRRYSGTKKEFQPLASTFLNQRMWEAELESGRKDEFSLLHLFNQQK